jgi:hypothetical protein
MVYLCGPINGCTDEECRDWREMVKPMLPFGTLDPMRRDYRGREAEAVVEIVEGDKADINQCVALLVNHPKPSVGTAMEILYAWERQKEIVIVVPTGASISPWLRYHSHGIYNTFADAIRHLRSRFE